jgi:pyruvate dehydrogenase E2 component (dihydrolipoamide acetyltransferase)
MPERDRSEQLVPFAMPSLGADMDEGTIVEWRVQPGSTVRRGDVVAVVETDKSDLDVEVFVDGTVHELVVPPGVRVPVGTVLATIDTAGTASRGGRRRAPATSVAPAAPAAPPGPAAPSQEPAPAVVQIHPAVAVQSPVLRHLADKLHIDVAHLDGSGPGGRITRDDIERAAVPPRDSEGGRVAEAVTPDRRPRVSPRARRLAATRGIDVDALSGEGRVVTGVDVLRWTAAAAPATATRSGGDAAAGGDSMRTAIARQMLRAWQEIPHFQVASTIELSRPLAALAGLNETRTAADRVLPAAMFVLAAARAAAQVPGTNGWWRDGAFEPAADVHVGVVIALRRGGLLVPVVRHADQKDLDTVMAEFRDLVTRARAGRLRASEMGGATFTLTQLGEGEVDTVVPIIHPPQVAILGLGAVRDAPWIDHGTVVVRPVVRATLAADHRAVDGRNGSAFLVALDRHLQEVCT